MGDIGIERREVEFEPLEDPGPAPEHTAPAVPEPGPAVPEPVPLRR